MAATSAPLLLPGVNFQSWYFGEVRQVGMLQPAVHRTIVIVDVESFSDPARTNAHHLAIREGMYQALQRSFVRARISWDNCETEDRGDGVLILVPPTVPKSRLVTSLSAHLADMLVRHNAACPALERIRLRMALHAGEVHPDPHGFAGTSINRAFRLIEAPASRKALHDSPGVLALIISDWFYDEVVRHHAAAEPVRFRQVRAVMKETEMAAWVRVLEDGGELARRDTGQPIPTAPARQSQPGKSMPLLSPEVRYSLPPDTSAFTGRGAELNRLTGVLTDAAGAGGAPTILTIDGMPGVGKTTLAVRAAHLLGPRFPDRQLFIDLQGHTPGQDPLTPEAALAGLLTAAGVDARALPVDLQGRTALWRDLMAGQQILLVLDNAACSSQVVPLLPGTDSCMVLVTSRRHLGDLPGAAAPVLLQALSPEEAREMFVRVALRAAADPAAAVAKLVRLAGFLPLAISLLARVYARHPSWTLADLTAETQASMLTLAAEKDSVIAAFEVSYQDLPPGQQEFFRRLGLHLGTTIDAYAAAALAGTGLREAAGQLDSLHGEGLLTETSYRRYGMHDLIRRYARDRAASDPAPDRERALERLLDYYQYTAALAEVQLASQTSASPAPAPRIAPVAAPALAEGTQALAWVRAERANLLACLDHATETGQHARAIALTAAMASLLRQDGPWTDAILRHAAAEQAARRLGDRRGEARALSNRGAIQRQTGNYRGAALALEAALGISRDLNDRPVQAHALSNLGAVLWLTGDYPGAARALEEALAISRDIGDRCRQADALDDLGVVRRLTGDYCGAARALEEALAISRDIGDRCRQADALDDLGVVRRLTGDYCGAAQALEEALAISRDIGDRLLQANALTYLGALQCQIGNHSSAVGLLEEALDIYRDIGNRRGEAELLNEAGTLHRVRGDPDRARARHLQALDLAHEIASPWDEAHALAGLGRCALVVGHTADAGVDLRKAYEMFKRIGAADANGIITELKNLSGGGSGLRQSRC